MKIYFAGSITGGRGDANIYLEIIKHLKTKGTVLTEHIGSKKLDSLGETHSRKYIHDRDIDWLLNSDLIVAEVTQVSLGVGYEIGRAVEHNKKILCLYRQQDGKRLSAMIEGCNKLTTKKYQTIEEAKEIINNFLK